MSAPTNILTSPVWALGRVVDRVRRRTEIPIVLCIDVEPDPRVFRRGEPPPWHGLERFIERLPVLRERLSEVTSAPAAFTWFLRMDPQVAETWGSPAWLAETYGDALAELARSGDELGLHVHTWRWNMDADEWVADYEDPAWMVHCLTMGLDAFETAFGRGCTVYRGGDHFLSGEMLACLTMRGVRADFTVEPGLGPRGAPGGERARGLLPDYREIPTSPYHSSPDTFPAPDPASRTGPLLIPLLSTPGRRGRAALFPEATPGRFVVRLAAQMVGGPPPVVAVAARTDSALDARWDFVASNLEHLARHGRMQFVTATAGMERFDHSS
jgi:hypothetical protein